MIKYTGHIAIYIIILLFASGCSTTKCVIYDLAKYKDNLGQAYVHIYDPTDSEWIKAEYIMKYIVAPAKWGTKRHQFCGLEYKLYICTTKKNHKKISQALPTLWEP